MTHIVAWLGRFATLLKLTFASFSDTNKFLPCVDCEQSLFCFRFSESSGARGSGEAPRRAKRGCLAPSVTRVAICVSRVLLDGLRKKERLLVV